MRTYYTEYPASTFRANNDEEAKKNSAKLVYRESDSEDGKPFVIVKDLVTAFDIMTERNDKDSGPMPPDTWDEKKGLV